MLLKRRLTKALQQKAGRGVPVCRERIDSQQEVVMVKDPVCGMDVDETSSPFRSEFEGVKYFFCSAGCKTAFDKNPGQYVQVGKEGPRHAHK